MKRFNLDEFLWFIILVLLDLFIIYLTLTKKVNFYIGNNMNKYTYIAISMLSIITIFQIKNIFTCKSNISIRFKLLPIIIALILGAISVTTLQTFKHAELGKDIIENKPSLMDEKALYEHKLDYNLNKNYKESTRNDQQNNIVVDESNPLVLEDIRINPEKYAGKELEIHGFVCKEKYLNKNQFIIGRIVMACCAADSKVIGIIGEYDKAYNLKENDRIKVIGEISNSSVEDDNNIIHNLPIIKIKELQKDT